MATRAKKLSAPDGRPAPRPKRSKTKAAKPKAAKKAIVAKPKTARAKAARLIVQTNGIEFEVRINRQPVAELTSITIDQPRVIQSMDEFPDRHGIWESPQREDRPAARIRGYDATIGGPDQNVTELIHRMTTALSNSEYAEKIGDLRKLIEATGIVDSIRSN